MTSSQWLFLFSLVVYILLFTGEMLEELEVFSPQRLKLELKLQQPEQELIHSAIKPSVTLRLYHSLLINGIYSWHIPPVATITNVLPEITYSI